MKGKTKFLILILVLLIVASAMIMVSCNKSKGNTGTTSSDTPSEVVVPGTDVNFTVYFYYLPTDTEPYAQITVKSGSKIKVADIPTNLTRDGYQFGGWYKNTSYSDEFNTNAVINKDIKLYALWIAPFTISFYEDLYDGVVNKTIKRFSNETVSQDEIYTPTKTGYEFAGWYLDTDYSQAYEFSDHLQRSISLYAKWNSTYAKLQFITNTKLKQINTISIEKDKPYTLPDPTVPTVSSENMTFVCWCTDKALTQELAGGTITILENTTVYAKWNFHSHTHTYEDTPSVFREANCTEAGGRACCCTVCGYYENEEVIPALGHNIYEREWLNGGTFHYHRCLRCGEEFDKASHTYNDGEITTKATCTADGEKTYTCTLCNATKSETIAALGHDINEDEWISDGEHHWHACTHEGCEEHFDEHEHDRVRDMTKDHESTGCSDPEVEGYKCSVCGADLSNKSEPIPHTYNVDVWEKDENQHWHICSVCNNKVELADHDYNIVVTKAATCTETGIRKYTCKKCGYVKEEKIPKTAHVLKWADESVTFLTDEQKALLPTYHYRYCATCHRVFEESKEEHTIDWTDKKSPSNPKGTVTITAQSTCTTHGTANVTCKVCGQTHYGVEVPLKDHTWELDGHVDCGCTTPGYDHYTCSVCHGEKQDTIPAAHRYVLVDEIANTCTKPGSRIYECATCGDRKTEVIPAGHTYTHYEYNETHHWHICESCHDTIDYEAHDFEMVMQNTPTTCGEDVYVMYRCKICSYYYTVIETGFGHEWDNGKVISDPTCTEPGYKEYTCMKCGEIRTETFGEPLGHDWDAGVITRNPTCTVPGERTYTCNRCHITRTESIPTIDHDWGEGVVTTEPTCTSTGVRTYTCSMCHATRTEVIPMVPHTYSDEPEILKYPTCTEEGERAFYCTVCHQAIREAIPALGHSWDSGTQTTDPTCTETGVMTYTCTRCHITKTEPVPALGHDYHDVVTPPTCTEKGYTTHTCARCGDVKVDTYVNALGHAWDDGVITTDPTCTTTGVKTYTCTRCHTTKTESVPMIPHTYGTTWTYLDEDHDALECIYCGHVKETREHDYDGYCCKYCHHHLLEKYKTKFDTHGSTATDAVVIESEEEYILFLDYVLSNYMASSKYYKFGGAFASTLISTYGNLTVKKNHETILQTYIRKCTTPVPSISTYLWNSNEQVVGIKWSLSLGGIETWEKAQFVEYYGTEFYSTDPNETCYDDSENENCPQQDYYFSEFSSTRTNSFDDFKYKEYLGTFDCVTSDQIVYAFQNYLKPNCSGRALSILNKAKAVLRNIVDDSMTDVEKVKAIYKWLVSNVTYDNAVLNPNNGTDTTDGQWVMYASWFAEGVFDYGYAVCDGISKAFTILTGLEGIRSVRITSNAQGHAWNKVFIDTNGDGVGEWYVVDATWGNTVVNGNAEMFNAKHLFMTDAQKAEVGCTGDNYADVEAIYSFNYYATETFTYNSEEYDLFIINSSELTILMNYLNENSDKTTTYKTVSVFICGSNVPTGVAFVEEGSASISGVQGKYYIIIIS